MLMGAVGCGGGGDRTGEFCGRVSDATCDKFVECRVLIGDDVVITPDVCAQQRAAWNSECANEYGQDIAMTGDRQLDACVQETAAFRCEDLCNQVPMDPPSCAAIGMSTPTMDVFTCQP